jgi:vacuolar-type H+-ATPase subunit E/Vma4
MEELRTTEVLGNEILEDARKKALKILKTSDDALAVQNRDWEKKIKRSVDSIRKTFAERTKKTNEEIQARFPLDKRRLRSETTESFLVKAMDDFLRTLSREKLLLVLERELQTRLKACTEDLAHHRCIIHYSGLSLEEAKGLLEKVPCQGDWEFKADSVVRKFPLIIIDSKVLRMIASVKSASKTLLKNKRAELAAVLLGEGVLND